MRRHELGLIGNFYKEFKQHGRLMKEQGQGTNARSVSFEVPG